MPSLTHHKSFRRGDRDSFTIPLAIRCRTIWSSNLNTRLRRSNPETQSLSRYLPLCSGPQAIVRFEANLAAADYTSHGVRQYTKPSAKPCLSNGSTFVPSRSAISSRGQNYSRAITVKGFFALDNSCKWPKLRHFIDDADIKPHFILFCNTGFYGNKILYKNLDLRPFFMGDRNDCEASYAVRK